jgi:uroporphyrinogen III methyltransferase/synthase
MTVYLVGAGPGDPGLLTRRGAQLLSEADVVLYDRLVHHAVLALAPVSAELIDVGKRPDGSSRSAALQEEINRLLVEHGRRRHTVVRLKGGDPFLFGRGGEEVEALTQAGVRWEIVPGVSSAFGVPAAAGIPVTHRGLSSSVTVVSGQVGPGPAGPAEPPVEAEAGTPARAAGSRAPGLTNGVNWEALAKVDGTLVILMGMMNRADIANALVAAGKPASTPAAVIERGTTTDQVVVRTTLGRLGEVTLGSPSVIVVGAVAALGAEPSLQPRPAPLSGRTVVVTRSGPRGRDLVDALHRAGAETVEIPLTAQMGPGDGGAALAAAAKEIDRYRWVVFTSVNAVDRLMGELRDARALSRTLVAAVGPATAGAVRAAGVEPDLVPSEHHAAGLVAEFPDPDAGPDTDASPDPDAGPDPDASPDPDAGPDPDPPGDLVLFPCAEGAPSTIPDGLAKKGWDVRRVHSYRTVALPPPEGWLLDRIAGADAVTFTASSSATAYAALKGPDGSPLPLPPLVVCMGPTTASDARALGMSGVEQADSPSSEGIVAALVRRLAR